ncbi:serine hydrolase domain-containing protein [Nocardia brasiliensis]|uniref:serine hydrolase domain-containing protein n=1 Tax=Nocardia brasiliensis TaxID=37326 RepID=UPI0033FF10BD
MVRIGLAHPPLFPPRSDWSYSNTNYVLAGMIIEQVTGQAPRAAVEQRIIAPLGLDDTTVPIRTANALATAVPISTLDSRLCLRANIKVSSAGFAKAKSR